MISIPIREGNDNDVLFLKSMNGFTSEKNAAKTTRNFMFRYFFRINSVQSLIDKESSSLCCFLKIEFLEYGVVLEIIENDAVFIHHHIGVVAVFWKRD